MPRWAAEDGAGSSSPRCRVCGSSARCRCASKQQEREQMDQSRRHLCSPLPPVPLGPDLRAPPTATAATHQGGSTASDTRTQREHETRRYTVQAGHSGAHHRRATDDAMSASHERVGGITKRNSNEGTRSDITRVHAVWIAIARGRRKEAHRQVRSENEDHSVALSLRQHQGCCIILRHCFGLFDAPGTHRFAVLQAVVFALVSSEAFAFLPNS